MVHASGHDEGGNLGIIGSCCYTSELHPHYVLHRPAKRKATTEISLPEFSSIPIRSEIWYDDGNIILEAERTQFRVFRGILSASSEVFRDMFAIPHPLEGEALVEVCAVVRLTDSAEDWLYVLKVLFERRLVMEIPYTIPNKVRVPSVVSFQFNVLTLGRIFDSPKPDLYLSYLCSVDIFARKATSAILTRRSSLITFYLSSCKPFPPHFSCSTLIVTATYNIRCYSDKEEAGSPEMVAENGHLIKCTLCLLCLALKCQRLICF
jgi:hypothetical protein